MPIAGEKYDPQAKEFELVPAGLHAFRFYGIIDVGTREDVYQGNPTYKHEFWLGFELSNTKMKDGRPFVVSQICNLSKSKFKSGLYACANSNLFKTVLKNWRPGLTVNAAGKPVAGVDLAYIIGLLGETGGMLVKHSPDKKDPSKKRWDIAAFMEQPPVECGPLVNPIMNCSTLTDAIPETMKWVQKRRDACLELNGGVLIMEAPKQTAAEETLTSDYVDDDIPF
jgi:hypothetical protein